MSRSFRFFSYVTCIYTTNSVSIYQIAHEFCSLARCSDVADLVDPVSGAVDDDVLITLGDLLVDVADH